MKQELQKEIFKKYPLLFGDKDKPMQETCMCWGLDIGDGWYKLVDELAGKLEPMIKDFIKQHPDTPCNRCSCPKDNHYAHRSWSPGKCLSIKQTAFWMPWNKRAPIFTIFKKGWENKVKFFINQTAYKLADLPYKIYSLAVRSLARTLQVFAHKYQACYCEKYEARYPRASQVKEKFGGLRFYMTTATEEMYALITEAEATSYKICDRCGGPGETTNVQGWIHAGCKECLIKEGRDLSDSWVEEDETDMQEVP